MYVGGGGVGVGEWVQVWLCVQCKLSICLYILLSLFLEFLPIFCLIYPIFYGKYFYVFVARKSLAESEVKISKKNQIINDARIAKENELFLLLMSNI